MTTQILTCSRKAQKSHNGKMSRVQIMLAQDFGMFRRNRKENAGYIHLWSNYQQVSCFVKDETSDSRQMLILVKHRLTHINLGKIEIPYNLHIIEYFNVPYALSDFSWA